MLRSNGKKPFAAASVYARHRSVFLFDCTLASQRSGVPADLTELSAGEAAVPTI
jgi:hypothetical protein